ncbi:MAG: hypothetical protein LVQ95_02300 [Candidatus Micrarchaeales archaeon]|nr:hypothetical protein [Candidatus Micrarchaeales archaeon]
MEKTGMVYRHIAERLLKNRKEKFVEREIARVLQVSPDTVSNAIAPLKRVGVASVYRRHVEITDFKKLLVFWAVHRKFSRDIVYQTYYGAGAVSEIEDRLPNEIAYTCFSGYTKNFTNDAADYSEVYVYADAGALKEIKRRFPKKEFSVKVGYSNLIVLDPDQVLAKKIQSHELEHSSVSLPQLYVDLWNLNTWYAYEFIKKLEKRIDDMYEKAILE